MYVLIVSNKYFDLPKNSLQLEMNNVFKRSICSKQEGHLVSRLSGTITQQQTPAMFSTIFQSVLNLSSKTSIMGSRSPVTSLILSRNLMKTHKGAAKRWRKTANSFKRGKAGRNHGNAGWSRNSLKSLSGRSLADSSHIQRLKRLLPYH